MEKTRNAAGKDVPAKGQWIVGCTPHVWESSWLQAPRRRMHAQGKYALAAMPYDMAWLPTRYDMAYIISYGVAANACFGSHAWLPKHIVPVFHNLSSRHVWKP
eukprot:364313-Chlamydomonas_euryale.AAC.2